MDAQCEAQRDFGLEQGDRRVTDGLICFTLLVGLIIAMLALSPYDNPLDIFRPWLGGGIRDAPLILDAIRARMKSDFPNMRFNIYHYIRDGDVNITVTYSLLLFKISPHRLSYPLWNKLCVAENTCRYHRQIVDRLFERLDQERLAEQRDDGLNFANSSFFETVCNETSSDFATIMIDHCIKDAASAAGLKALIHEWTMNKVKHAE
jgi:hypothetical protein